MNGEWLQREIRPEETEAYLAKGYIVEGDTVKHYALPEELEFYQHVPKLAASHLGGSLGIELVGYQPLDIKYSDQRMVETHREVSPFTSIDLMTGIIRKQAALRRILDMSDGFRARPGLLRDHRERLEAGQSICILVPHTVIYDLPFPPVAEAIAFGEDAFIQRCGFIMSKLIPFIQVTLEDEQGNPSAAPAPEVLSLAGTSWYSIPRTTSIVNSLMDNSVAETLNPQMRKEFGEWLGEGGKLVAIAPSASTLKDGYIERMSSGTAATVASFDAVLPVAMDIRMPASERWFIIGETTEQAHNNPEAAHELMDEMAEDMTSLTGIPHEYKKMRETPRERAQEIGEKAKDVAHQATQQMGKWTKQWRERRNKRWDKLHGKQ